MRRIMKATKIEQAKSFVATLFPPMEREHRKELLERIADSAQINHDYIVLMSLSNGRLRDVKRRSKVTG